MSEAGASANGASRSCVNCGAPRAAASVCRGCGSDPVLLNAVRDLHLSRASGLGADPIDDLVGSPQEDRALVLALALTVAFTFLLSAVTLGAFLVLVGASVARVYMMKFATRADMVGTGTERFSLIDQLARTAAFRLGLPPIEVFVGQSAELNAYTTGVGRHSWIVLSSALVEALAPEELLYVLGHEMGHIKRRHVFWNLLIGNSALPPLPVAGAFFRLVFSGWSQAAEYAADRAGLLATRHPDPCLTTLIKLAVGPEFAGKITKEEFLQALRGQSEVATALAELGRTHPLTANRIDGILRFWSRVKA